MPPAPDTRSCSAHLPAVLHLSSAAGGGADRYVRDLARDSARRHYLWHTGAGLDVIEDLAARRFFPLAETASHAAGDALARFARSARLGLLHLHAVDAASRARITRLVSLTGLPFVATLHDLGIPRRAGLRRRRHAGTGSRVDARRHRRARAPPRR